MYKKCGGRCDCHEMFLQYDEIRIDYIAAEAFLVVERRKEIEHAPDDYHYQD